MHEGRRYQRFNKNDWDDIKFIYDKLVHIRNTEKQLVWTRISLMLAIQGLLISFLTIQYTTLYQFHFLVLILSLGIGLYLSIVLLRIVWSGWFWVDWWGEKLKKIEREYKIFDIFTADTKGTKLEPKYISSKGIILEVSIVFCVFWSVILILSVITKAGFFYI